MSDERDWFASPDDPLDIEALEGLPAADRGALHDAGQDAKRRLDLARRLMEHGVPLAQIPIADPDEMERLLQDYEPPSPEQSLGRQVNDLADGMDQFRNDARARGVDPDAAVADLEQFDDENALEGGDLHLAGKMKTREMTMLKPTPKRVWTKGEDSIPGPPVKKKTKKRTRKAQFETLDLVNEEPPAEEPAAEPQDDDVQSLLEKLEDIVGAMGDSAVDPSLAAAATIIARRLLSRLGDMTMDAAGVPEEEEPSLEEELAEAGGAARTASILIRAADRLDSLEIPIIPDLVDECLVRLAQRLASKKDFDQYDPGMPKEEWTPKWKKSEGKLPAPHRDPIGIDSSALAEKRREKARDRKLDSEDAMLQKFVDPDVDLRSLPRTTLMAIREISETDRLAKSDMSSKLLAQIMVRPPNNPENIKAKADFIQAFDRDPGLKGLFDTVLGQYFATSNPENVRSADSHAKEKPSLRDLLRGTKMQKDVEREFEQRLERALREFHRRQRQEGTNERTAASFYRQYDPEADPFEAHRIRRHIKGEAHTIPTELKDRIIARGLATPDEFEEVSPGEWQHLNTKYENRLRDIGDTMQMMFRAIDQPPTREAGKADIRRRLRDISKGKEKKPARPEAEEDVPVLEQIRRREEQQRRFPAKDYTFSDDEETNVRSAQVDDTAQKLVDMLLESGGLQSLGVARKLDVSQSTAKRILKRLADAGIVVQDSLVQYRKDGSGGRVNYWRLSDQYKAEHDTPIEQSNTQPIEQSNTQFEPTPTLGVEQSSNQFVEQSTNQVAEPMGSEVVAEPMAAAAARAASGRHRVKWAQVVQRMQQPAAAVDPQTILVGMQCEDCGRDLTQQDMNQGSCTDCGRPINDQFPNDAIADTGQSSETVPLLPTTPLA